MKITFPCLLENVIFMRRIILFPCMKLFVQTSYLGAALFVWERRRNPSLSASPVASPWGHCQSTSVLSRYSRRPWRPEVYFPATPRQQYKPAISRPPVLKILHSSHKSNLYEF